MYVHVLYNTYIQVHIHVYIQVYTANGVVMSLRRFHSTNSTRAPSGRVAVAFDSDLAEDIFVDGLAAAIL